MAKPRVSPSVGGSSLPGYGREADDQLGPRTRLEYGRLGVTAHVVGDGEGPECAASFRVGLTLGMRSRLKLAICSMR